MKGSLVHEGEGGEPPPDLSDIEFYGENETKIYDIDAAYIDRLLETYSAHNQNTRDEIEKALQKLNKPEVVKDVYHTMLNAIDDEEVDSEEDILAVKRQYFTQTNEQAIEDFANTWFVKEGELHSSAIQYELGTDSIPNISGILNSKQFDQYKAENPEAKPFKYGPEMKRQWKKELNDVIVPLNDELR